MPHQASPHIMMIHAAWWCDGYWLNYRNREPERVIMNEDTSNQNKLVLFLAITACPPKNTQICQEKAMEKADEANLINIKVGWRLAETEAVLGDREPCAITPRGESRSSPGATAAGS
jgi:hypothetical protein